MRLFAILYRVVAFLLKVVILGPFVLIGVIELIVTRSPEDFLKEMRAWIREGII